MDWYRQAAEQDDTEGQYSLGLFYQQGQVTAVELVEAYAWFAAAQHNGDSSGRDRCADTEKQLTEPKLKDAHARASLNGVRAKTSTLAR